MNLVWTLSIGWVALSCLSGFLIMGIDKSRAVGRGRRVPEKTLFALVLVGGAFGILAGSGVFRHKTRKHSFTGVVLLAAFIWVAILAELQVHLGSPF